MKVVRVTPPQGWAEHGTHTMDVHVNRTITHDGVSQKHLPEFYAAAGTVEGLLRQLGGIWCKGNLRLFINGRKVRFLGELQAFVDDDVCNAEEVIRNIERKALEISHTYGEQFRMIFQFDQAYTYLGLKKAG